MQPQLKSVYEFGPFQLDPAAHVLVRDGKSIPLPPKAFDTLLVLVRQRGNLLAKEELLNAVWPDSFVEENNLNQYVSMLRKVLGQNGAGSKYIETIPRLGYRFVAEVREVEGDAKSSPALRTQWMLRAGFISVPLILLLLVGLAYRNWSPVEPPTVSASTTTLAVLPLRNLKPDADTDFLSMALTDAIINRLGYVGELSVQPFSLVAGYRDSDSDPRQVGRELKVQNVLTGSYVKEGDDLRVTTELISVATGATPARDNIELKYEKLLTVQDRVAVSVIHSLGLELRPEEADRLKRDVPTNPVAYEYYLRGTDRGFVSDFQGAMQLLEQSVAAEPGNAMAWAELGTAYLGYARVQGGASDYVDKGWAAFHQAIDLDATNRFVVDEMAFQLVENNRGDEAIPLLRESLRHNATDSFAHWYLSEAYRYGGALDQSIQEGELALKLNPIVADNLTFNTYLYVGDYQKFLNSLPQDEKSARTVFYRGLAYYYLKDRQRAGAEFERAFALNPKLIHAQMGRALQYAMEQRPAAGVELMKQIERTDSNDGEMVYKMAQVYAQLGDGRSSLRLLRRSIELSFSPYSYFLHDPLLDPVRTQPEYSAVIELARQRQERFRQQFM